jgi:hypothetical protein
MNLKISNLKFTIIGEGLIKEIPIELIDNPNLRTEQIKRIIYKALLRHSINCDSIEVEGGKNGINNRNSSK